MLTGKEIFKFIAFVFLIAIIGFVIFTTINIITSEGIDFFSINPPDKLIVKHLFFPPLGASDTLIQKRNETNLPLLSVDIALQYNGILSEGTPVKVFATGWIYPEGLDSVSSLGEASNNHVALVGFKGATTINSSKPNTTWLTNGQFFVILESISDLKAWNPSPGAALPSVIETVVWDTQGDYYPIITVGFKNGTTVIETYPDVVIHVSSPDIVQQEKYSKINTWLTVALFFFTLMTSVQFLYWVAPNKVLRWFGIENKNSKSEDNPPSNPSPKSNIQQPLSQHSDTPDVKHKKKK